MAGTLGDMKTRIADEIARADLTSQIANAINDAILIYQKERLRFNETFTTMFTTVATQQNYTVLADSSFSNVASLQQFYHIDWLTITVGIAVFDVPRYQPEEILILTQTASQAGQPYAYAVDNETIMLYPVPSDGYLMTLGGHITYAAPSSDAAPGNRWMTDGERLIRNRAKYELAVHVTKDDTEALRMSPLPNGQTYLAWKELKGEATDIQARGRIRGMTF